MVVEKLHDTSLLLFLYVWHFNLVFLPADTYSETIVDYSLFWNHAPCLFYDFLVLWGCWIHFKLSFCQKNLLDY